MGAQTRSPKPGGNHPLGRWLPMHAPMLSRSHWDRLRPVLTGAAALAGVTVLAGWTGSEGRQPVPGDPKAGVGIIIRQACGSCHQIPGVQQAIGLVGPPLGGIAARVYLAGHILNTPDNMITWLRFPQTVVPGNPMPDMGLDETEARDVAAYLYTMR